MKLQLVLLLAFAVFAAEAGRPSAAALKECKGKKHCVAQFKTFCEDIPATLKLITAKIPEDCKQFKLTKRNAECRKNHLNNRLNFVHHFCVAK